MTDPKAQEAYPTESQIDEMFNALETGDDEQILALLRKRKQERQAEAQQKET